jgi:hypothetical protein
MFEIDLKAYQHLSAQMHENFNETAKVIWEFIADWQLQAELLKFFVRLGVVESVQIELSLILALRLLYFLLLLITDIGMITAARVAQRWWPIQMNNRFV